MRVTLLLAAAVILVRDPTGKWAGDPLEPWFQSLHNKRGLYCLWLLPTGPPDAL